MRSQRFGSMCGQPDLHWNCFERNISDIAERQGGGHIGILGCCDVILISKLKLQQYIMMRTNRYSVLQVNQDVWKKDFQTVKGS